MTTTPNMNLVLPDPQITVGPEWASMLNTALEAIDSHDHSSSSGVKITPAGLNINANLDVNEWSLESVGSVDLAILSDDVSSGSARIYSYLGELYYRDDEGNNVRLTLDGAVDAGGTGAITGLTSPASASYSEITGTFTWLENTDQLAKMALGDLVLYKYGEVSANPITIKPPDALAAAYSITLPAAVPSSTYPLTINNLGQLESTGTVGLTQGSVSTPALYLNGDTDTGLYQVASNSLGIALGGQNYLTLSASSATFSHAILSRSGDYLSPGVAFSSDTDTGIYLRDTNTLGITAGGSAALSVASGVVSTLANVHRFSDGSASVPSLSFTSDIDTGMYLASANNLALATGGAIRGNFNSTGLQVTGSLNIDSGGAFKVSVITGTITATSGGMQTVYSGATVYGAFGFYLDTSFGASAWGPISDDGGSGSVGADVFITHSGGSSTTVRLANNAASSRSYRLVVFHA